MNVYKFLVAISARIAVREWHATLLAFFSLFICVVSVVIMVGAVSLAQNFVAEEKRAISGGDVRVSGNSPIEIDILREEGISYSALSDRVSFNGLITNDTGEAVTVEFDVVDTAYPLYGVVDVASGSYTYPNRNEILIDERVQDILRVEVGDFVFLGDVRYQVKDILQRQPDSVAGSLQFFPRVIMGMEGYAESGLAGPLLRANYTRSYAVSISDIATREKLIEEARTQGYRLRFGDSESSRVFFGLETVKKFLGMVSIFTLLLGMINIYSCSMYIFERYTRTATALFSLGVTKGIAYIPAVLALLYGTFFALISGLFFGVYILSHIYDAVKSHIALPSGTLLSVQNILFVTSVVTVMTCVVISLAFVEHVGFGMKSKGKWLHKSISRLRLLLAGIAVIPLCILAYFFTGDVFVGSALVGGILVFYVFAAWVYGYAVAWAYRIRGRFSFFVRSIISWKKYDGIFGSIAFASLFSACTIVILLALCYGSILNFIREDIGQTIPSVYVLDIQEVQEPALRSAFPDLTLIPTLRARIATINDVSIREYMETDGGEERGELRREFFATATTTLPARDVEYEARQPFGTPGTVSIDKEFAERVGLRIGDVIEFLIQGFSKTLTIEHVRVSDTASGLPFFYFILSPDDVRDFTATSFGYAYYSPSELANLRAFSAKEMPQVSILDTAAAQAYVARIVALVERLMFFVTIPLVTLAVFLVVTLIIEQYHTRQRDGFRLMTLGAPSRMVAIRMSVEMMSTTCVAALSAYFCSALAAWYIVRQYLEIPTFVAGSSILWYGGIIIIVMGISINYMRYRDTTSLHDALMYEDNH